MTTHLTDIEISAFRGLKDVKLSECGAVNLLVGGNNSGKTSVLEAIFLLAQPHSIDRWYRVQQIRSSWPLYDILTRHLDKTLTVEFYFPRLDGELGTIQVHAHIQDPLGLIEPLELKASAIRMMGVPPLEPKTTETEFEEGRSRADSDQGELFAEVPGLQIRTVEGDFVFTNTMWEGAIRPQQNSPSKFEVEVINSVAHRSEGFLSRHVSELIKSQQLGDAEKMFRSLDDKVLRLVIAESTSYVARRFSFPTVNVEYEGLGFLPIQAMGDGIRRALLFSAVVSGMKGGVLLIDEVEVGMHTTVLKDVFKWLTAACKKAGIQVFMTTHSLEAIDAIIESVDDEDLVLYRLSNGDVKRYDGELLRSSRFDFGYEVR